MRIAERNPIFKCELQSEISFSDVPLLDVPLWDLQTLGTKMRQNWRAFLCTLYKKKKRMDLLRTSWKQRVLRSLLRGLRVQGALSCPTRRVFLCTLHTVPNRPSKNLLTTQPHRVLRSPLRGLCVQRAQTLPFRQK